MTVHVKKYSIEGTAYHYRSQGEGEALVFLHGFTGSSQTWEPFVDTWKESYHVITIDLPGHGLTKGNADLSMQEVCRHLAILFNYLNIETCHLIGYSMGGRTALSFAMWYPEYITSLILESASPGLRTEAERIDRVKKDHQLASRIRQEGMKSFVDYWETIPLFDTQKKLPLSIRQNIRKERLQQTEEGLATSLTSIGTGSQPSWWNKLTTLAIDVCLIVGEKDIKFVQINEQMHAQITESELHIVPEAGHAVHIEQPTPFHHLVEYFIQKNSK